MAETKSKTIAAPRPPAPLPEQRIAAPRVSFGANIPRVGCALCGRSECQCGKPDAREAALQSAGLL